VDETPPLDLPRNLPVFFSVEQSPSMYIDTYHGSVRDLGKLKNSEIIPQWVQDWIIQRVPPPKDPAKLSFLLQKHAKSSLPEMPADTNRLTANRMLRIKKVLQYLAEKLSIELDPACYGSQLPKPPNGLFIELYCNGKVVSIDVVITTATDFGYHQVRAE
jgi:WD repeat-containing protein 48